MLCTTTADGDMRPTVAEEERRRAILDRRWVFVEQVHGAMVHFAKSGEGEPERADALVTGDDDLALALLGADCVLIGLASREGIRGAAHAGWRGLLAGVVGATVAAMRGLGATEIVAVTSPAIGPECYPFSPQDLAPLSARFGEIVLARSSAGEPALDLPRGVAVALERAGVAHQGSLGGCTSCDPRFYSYRRGRDVGRHALVVHGGGES